MLAFNQPVSAANDANDVEHIAVVTQQQAYRGNVPLKELPQSIDIISDELLDSLGVLSFQNALKFSSGIASQNNFGGLWDSFAIRGFAGNENAPAGYLVNGFNVGRGFSGTRDASSIESIEVLKGPGSALYGRGEPGGTINVITKKPQFAREGYVEASIGSDDFYRIEGDFTDAINQDMAFRVNGSYQDAGSFRDTITSQKLALTPSFAYHINADTSVFYELELVDQEAPFDRGIVVPNYQLDTVPINTFYGEPNDGPIDIEALGHQLSLQSKLNQNWSLNGGVSYRDSSFEGYSTEVELSAGRQLLYTTPQTVSRQRRHRDYDTTDLSGRIELSGQIEASDITHHLLLGSDAYQYRYHQQMQRWRTAWGAGDTRYSVDLLNPQYGETPPEVAPVTDRTEEQQSFGVYIQDQIDLSEKWKILLGLRFDDYQNELENHLNGSINKIQQTATSPRLGATYVANDNYTAYVSYSEGFRPNGGTDVNGNAFDPEASRSYEAGVKYTANQGDINANFAIFHAKKSNILGSDPVNSGFSIALGEASSEGVELDMNVNLDQYTLLTLSYAFIRAKTDNSLTNVDWDIEIPAGSQLINIPKHAFNITAQRDTQLFGYETALVASVTYVGDRLGETIDPNYQLPSYVKVDISGIVNLQDNLTLKFIIDNLLDKTYYDNSYSALWTQPGTPRSARVSMKYSF
ncbi:TonB-dependent siderophore receptor [Alteromonas sp. a30]|nr:TonB-dependent siderophore receptor [Alteromonas sp. a30]